MHLDTNLLLTAEKLHLEPGLLRGKIANGTFAFKRIASQSYLVVNELQAAVLEEFTQAKNVPEALESCIRRRSCTPLREFYDLILKAHRAGVLRSEELGAEGPARAKYPPSHWLVSLPPAFALSLACIGFVATLVAVILRPPLLPATSLDVLTGWLATCAALSLGQALAASTLRGAKCEVHRPHLRWLSLTPHFAVDLDDSCMATRPERAAVISIALLPLALTAAVAVWRHEPWALVPLVVLFFTCRPVGRSPLCQLLLLVRRRPLVDTERSSLFEAPSSLGEKTRDAWKRFDVRSAGLLFVTAVAWAAAVSFTVYRGLHLDPRLAFEDIVVWKQILVGVGVLLGVIMLWSIANVVQHHVVDVVAATWRRWSVNSRRWLSGKAPLADSADAEMLIRRNPLLRRLAPEVQAELAQHVRPFTARAWRTLIAFDEDPPFVGLILSGTATVYRRVKSGRKTRFLRVMEGDLFGAHKLVDPSCDSVEIRANTPFSALVIDAADFKRLVVGPLGAAMVRNYVHKHMFLQRASRICADWRPAAIARFAELAATAAHPAGGKIIHRGQEVGNLYVLYEGHARTFQGKKMVGRINPGDFFGEISLLQTSAATADVESNDDSRCLVVNRIEFIRFMSRNHHVALQMERLCSKRLGHPVFPLDRHASYAR